MTLTAEEKKTLSEHRLKKAESLLQDAALLLEQRRWESSINRSYYAAMNAAKAGLILLGSDPKSHNGVKSMVGKKLVLDGLIPKEAGKWFRSLSFEREDVDYADYVTVDQNDAESAFEDASNFVDKIKQIAPGLISRLVK